MVPSDIAARALNAMPIGVMVFEAVRQNSQIVDFLWLYQNAASAILVGQAELIGATLLSVFPGYLESGIFAQYVLVVETQQPTFFETEAADSLSNCCFKVQAVPFEDGLLVTFSEVTGYKARAETDLLTGIPNRSILKRASRARAVLLLDLDRFKQVNDRYGHLAGDAVLKAVSARLQEALSCLDCGEVGRMGGDEFLLVIKSDIDLAWLTQRLISLVKQPILFEGQSLTVGCSIGAVVNESRDAMALVELADQALRQAKEQRGQAVVASMSCPIQRYEAARDQA